MRPDSDPSDNALSATARKSNWRGLSLLTVILLAAAVAIIMILDHRNSVNNALETGQCLAEEGAENILGVLRHFLHHAYRWIFKACG
ncbi:hypothetical protein HFD92_01760 [Pantoea sp. EKM101V]|uniref:hypothetical protein n=1 Tax=Pantoea sp. EKM101V TaxID=1683695 RepID=UPI00142E1A78|nr:hypothetical protein [Pantoea sp. EKM101V]KAF6668975.1 hypothetical protein HFD92_01760 [Pantoea sp. EKM101V]